MTEGDRMLPLELREALGVRGVWRLAVRHRERGFPDPRVQPERGLEACGGPVAQHRGPLESVTLDGVPPQPGGIARGERAHAEEPGDIRRQSDRGEGSPVAAQLVDPKGRDDLLDPFPQRLDEIRQRIRVAGRKRVLDEQVRVHRVGAEAERDDDVVQVADAARGDDERGIAAERAGGGRLGEERTMHRSDNEERIEPGPSFRGEAAVGDDHQGRPRAHRATGLRAEARERVACRFVPVPVGRQQGRAVRREVGGEVLEEPGPERPRDGTLSLRSDARLGRVPAEEDRLPELDPPPVARAIERWPGSEDRARREVLDLALAVDRRIRDDRDRLLEMVGEVHPAQ